MRWNTMTPHTSTIWVMTPTLRWLPYARPVGTLIDLLANLSGDARLRGKQFEHVCKWFLTNDPVYRQELRRCGCGMNGQADGAPMQGSTSLLRTTMAIFGQSRRRLTTLPTRSQRPT